MEVFGVVFNSGSVSRLLNGHVTSYSEREGLPTTLTFVECKDGSLIVGTVNGLVHFKNTPENALAATEFNPDKTWVAVPE
jgi:ligand-binding sensor domain-containing protein